MQKALVPLNATQLPLAISNALPSLAVATERLQASVLPLVSRHPSRPKPSKYVRTTTANTPKLLGLKAQWLGQSAVDSRQGCARLGPDRSMVPSFACAPDLPRRTIRDAAHVGLGGITRGKPALTRDTPSMTAPLGQREASRSSFARRLHMTTARPRDGGYYPATPLVQPTLELHPEDLNVIAEHDAEYIAKVVVATDDPVKEYELDPSGALYDRRSAIGHTFVAVFNKWGDLVEVFDHGPGAPRAGETKTYESLPIPAEFSTAHIDVVSGRTHNIMPKGDFDARFGDTPKHRMRFKAPPRDARSARTIDTLSADALTHNVILGFRLPITHQQLEELRYEKERLQAVGYDARLANCSSMSRALLRSCLSAKGTVKWDRKEQGPHLLHDIGALQSLVRAATESGQNDFRPEVQQHAFDRGDTSDLRSFFKDTESTPWREAIDVSRKETTQIEPTQAAMANEPWDDGCITGA